MMILSRKILSAGIVDPATTFVQSRLIKVGSAVRFCLILVEPARCWLSLADKCISSPSEKASVSLGSDIAMLMCCCRRKLREGGGDRCSEEPTPLPLYTTAVATLNYHFHSPGHLARGNEDKSFAIVSLGLFAVSHGLTKHIAMSGCPLSLHISPSFAVSPRRLTQQRREDL
jgi:hypothetical protein